MSDFLLEIGTEEIPARMIDSARDELSRRTADLLTRERLAENPAIAILLHAPSHRRSGAQCLCPAARCAGAAYRPIPQDCL